MWYVLTLMGWVASCIWAFTASIVAWIEGSKRPATSSLSMVHISNNVSVVNQSTIIPCQLELPCSNPIFIIPISDGSELDERYLVHITERPFSWFVKASGNLFYVLVRIIFRPEELSYEIRMDVRNRCSWINILTHFWEVLLPEALRTTILPTRLMSGNISKSIRMLTKDLHFAVATSVTRIGLVLITLYAL